MKTYKTPYTEKFPFRYTIELLGYIVHTTNEDKHNKLIKQITEKDLTSFTPQQVLKLEVAGFTVIRTL
jgi:hypothetical protein